MNERDLQRVLRLAAGQPEAEPARAGFADGVMARLPVVVRFVIPGSSPGGRVLVIAGVLALATAAVISLSARPSAASVQGTSGAAAALPSSSAGLETGSEEAPVSQKSPPPGRPGFQLFQPQEPQYRPAVLSKP